MAIIIFDGKQEALKREALLKAHLNQLGRKLRMGSVVFVEDLASVLYTNLKMKAAERVGIGFYRVDVSIRDEPKKLEFQITALSERLEITGVMVQKPAVKTWLGVRGSGTFEKTKFQEWWEGLTSKIDPEKDADCLTQTNLKKVYDGSWTILPATVKAVLTILGIAYSGSGLGVRGSGFGYVGGNQWAVLRHTSASLSTSAQDKWTVASEQKFKGVRVAVVGRSELVGKPLAVILTQKGAEVTLCGSDTKDLAAKVRQAEVVISATGIPGIIKGNMVKEGAVVIDVGSPKGDVLYPEVIRKARFITPVPGGVGPMTVISLMENMTALRDLRSS